MKPYTPKGIFQRGSKPTFKHSFTRERISVFGVLSENEFSGQMTEERCNAQTYLQFVKLLIRKYGKIVLIVDGAKYHFEKELVQKFYNENKERLKIIQLPPYSPELNPIEQTWKKIKAWLATRIWSNKEELQQQLVTALNNPIFITKFYDYLVR